VGSLHAVSLTSIDQLRAAAPAWDDLWCRSEVALPTARAELIAQWVEQFRPDAAFRAVAIEADGRWIAALPLVDCRVGWLIPAGGLPGNAWSPCGDLLLDHEADADAAIDLLLASAGRLPWLVLWLNETSHESPRWRALLRGCDRAGILATHHEQYRVGRVEIREDWHSYERQLPKNHRQAMNRAARRLGAEGRLQFERCSHCDADQVEPWLQRVFEVEDRGWKGRTGTSVLRTPGMFQFFVRRAEQHARWGQLEIATLRLQERVIASLYGFRGKGVYFAHKIGYDPDFAAFSPGQLLFFLLLEQLHHDGDVQALDFMGPLNQSLSRWRPATYGVGRLALAMHRPLGRAAIYAYKNWWPRLCQVRAGCSLDAGVPVVDAPPLLT
jgi:CelD/BcsL family acetyltransferase involved in cellulose biosynthesis